MQLCTETSPFLQQWQPFDVLVKDRVARWLLPDFLYQRYLLWRNTEAMGALVALISQSFNTNVNVRWREVGNNAPKYYDYEISVKKEGVDTLEPIAYGQSFTSAVDAESRALGEFLERMMLRDIDVPKTVVATKKKLGTAAAPIESAPLYLSWQKDIKSSFVTRAELPDVPLSWVKAKSLIQSKERFVPADRVFWGQYDERSSHFNQPTSNGNGGGFSFEAAVLSGLYELIERDSFMCYWLLQLPATKIIPDQECSEVLQEKLAMALRYKQEVLFYDITTSLDVPVVLCVIIDRHDVDDPKIAVGAAAGYNTDKLLQKSYLEALVVLRRHWFSHTSGFTEEPPSPHGFFDSKSFDENDWEHRLDCYRGPMAETAIAFLHSGIEITYQSFKEKYFRSQVSVKEELSFLKKKFSELVKTMPGMHPYVYRVKRNSLLQQLNYHVVSVVVPQLFPLYLTEHQATLDISTLTHWQQTAALHAREWRGVVSNNYPHPFP